MSRNPRGTCPRPPSRSAAPESAGATALASGPCRPRPMKPPLGKTTIPKRGPPPAPPKKLDYKKPGMTKAMMQRLKHAEKLREDMERKERERAQATAARRPKRTAAPPGGDARMRRPDGRCPRPTSKEPPACPVAASEPPSQPATCPPSRGASPCPRGKSPGGPAAVPTRTRNLAASMNADIVQAEPLQAGPVDNVIIPPGTINSERTTIVSIPQQSAVSPLPSSTIAPGSSPANKSVQVISETLDEQDAAESSIVNSKLQDLQQARRDFVMAVANVGGNAINLQDDELANVTPISDITPPYLGSPEPPSPRLYRCPSIEQSYFIPEYKVDDPGAEARRQYLRERGKYIDPFAQLHSQPEEDEEYIEQPEGLPGGLFDDDACPYPQQPLTFNLPRREPYEYLPCDVERLERFFDLEHFPTQGSPQRQQTAPSGPPPGRECLPPDLWDLEDPWYIEAEEPDLIQF